VGHRQDTGLMIRKEVLEVEGRYLLTRRASGFHTREGISRFMLAKRGVVQVCDVLVEGR